MRIRTFQGLRPAREAAAQLVSLPYDVVDTEEARQLAADNPLSFLHVVRPEIDFPKGQDPYADAVYAQAATNLRRLIDDRHLVRESEPCAYLYQLEMGNHRQCGIVALSHVDDYDQDRIRKHEKTRVAKENDRTRLTDTLSANTGPVFLTYQQTDALRDLSESGRANAPLYDLTTEDNIRHTVWKLTGAEALANGFAEVPFTYVADGHHRAASAARVARERREANPQHTGDEDYNFFLTVLFPAEELKILPYNRLVTDLNGYSKGTFLQKLESVGPVSPVTNGQATAPAELRFYLGDHWHSLQLPIPPDADPVSRLDVSLLQNHILQPLLGIEDPRTSERVAFVGGIRGDAYLADQVDKGNMAAAFALYPVTVRQLMDIADAGQIMPPKSTWFEPKLRSGFFIHTF